jgi:hypothetical protein
VRNSSAKRLRAELISAAEHEQLPVASNLHLCAVCENKGGGVAERRVAVGVEAEVKRGNGDEGTIRWKDGLKTHT